MTSSVIYYSKDARKNEIYLLNIFIYLSSLVLKILISYFHHSKALTSCKLEEWDLIYETVIDEIFSNGIE